jgi:hypothetical protein
MSESPNENGVTVQRRRFAKNDNGSSEHCASRAEEELHDRVK